MIVDRWSPSAVRRLPVAVLFAASLAASAAPAAEDKLSAYDRAWRLARLYEGDADTSFQSFVLSGRLQLDLAYVDSGDDDHGELNVRRFRFGFKTVFLRNFTFHLEGVFEVDGLVMHDQRRAWR